MTESIGVGHGSVVQLENYKFSGIDASLIGAIKSVSDYYQIPLSTSWVYGMTGLAFLHVLDENLVEPNGGPPEQKVFHLTRNIGLEVQGLHVYAEAEEFHSLQFEAWEKAKLAINSKQPVFAKNLDIENQTSLIYAYDDVGYYTHSWHAGYKDFDKVIPWNSLGLSHCPCINCVNYRQSTKTVNPSSGLISLHWATSIQPVDELTAFKEALEFVIRLNEEGSYKWAGKTYFVGSKAYEKWLTALESDSVDKYFFSLFVEVLNEARSHAIKFLSEIKKRNFGISEQLMDDSINKYSDVSAEYKLLRDMYPYQEPRESEIKHKEQCIAIVTKLYQLERDCLKFLKEINKSISL